MSCLFFIKLLTNNIKYDNLIAEKINKKNNFFQLILGKVLLQT